jgi:hypothetical protein
MLLLATSATRRSDPLAGLINAHAFRRRPVGAGGPLSGFAPARADRIGG